jgi:type II secretory ATPase GspE/PulE/Tfp pilus assembly ATPase PilB-like protein
MPELKLFRRKPDALPTGQGTIQSWEGMLAEAIKAGASDIHCEPKADGLRIRFRIDGDMCDYRLLPVSERDALLARGKIAGGMDITEKRLPQDGRAVWAGSNQKFHLRLSTVPTVHGESLVVRLLNQQMPAQDFAALGFSPTQAADLTGALTGPAGLILLTGPTGSGKTTSLHAALQSLDHRTRVIHTLEEPVEYEFEGIRQTEIREKIGLTFASTLRALLRQNPDVMLVGETRDSETARLAVRAALTGHTVLSTLHTNDALAAVPRLRDLGIEAFLLAASLRLVAAQRLVRRLCPECKRPHRDLERLRAQHALPDARFCQPEGCAACHGRGFSGRLAIHEILPMEKFLPLIAAAAPQEELVALRDRLGGATLWQHGLATAGAGLTTLEEVIRVL